MFHGLFCFTLFVVTRDYLLSQFFCLIETLYLLRYWTKQANSWYVAPFVTNCQVDEMNDVSLSEKICQK
jgi:hypothetical protein